MEFEQTYRESLPHLMAALGRLARQGFPLPLSEAMDMIHAFYAEEWPTLRSQYDPARGGVMPYIYVAFTRFARKQIIRRLRLRARLLDPGEMEGIVVDATQEQGADRHHDVRLLRDALGALPAHERGALDAFLEASTERKAAERMSVSRYRLHETLGRALGMLAVAIERPSFLNEDDWRVTRMVLGEGLTVREAAARLGREPAEVRATHRHNLEVLVRGLRESYAKSSITRKGEVMQTNISTRTATSIAALIRAVANDRENNRALIEELRARAAEAVSYLEEATEMIDEVVGKEPESLARLYAALGGEEAEQEDDELINLAERDEKTVGEAVKDVLLVGLPDKLLDFKRWFGRLPKLASGEVAWLRDEPSVIAAMPEIEPLLQWGITPLTIVTATGAVGGLIEGVIDDGELSGDTVVTIHIDPRSREVESEPIGTDRFVAEIAMMSHCEKRTARALLGWMVRVAEYKPRIFDGLEAEMTPNGLELRTIVEGVRIPLGDRWGLVYHMEEE